MDAEQETVCSYDAALALRVCMSILLGVIPIMTGRSGSGLINHKCLIAHVLNPDPKTVVQLWSRLEQ